MSFKLTQPTSIENENLLNKDKIILENINEEIKETKGIYHQSKAVNETVIKVEIPKIEREQLNTSEFIFILDKSGSMGNYVNKIITKVMPRVFDLLQYPDNKIFHFISFESYVSYCKMKKEEFLNSLIDGGGGTRMQNVPLKLKEILKKIPNYSNINLLTLSDGIIGDQNETENNAEKLHKELNGSYNNINSKAISFMSSFGANPDTKALCSLLRFNSLQNSNKNDFTTYSPKNSLNNEEIEEFANIIASLFPNYLSNWVIYSKDNNLRIEPNGKTFNNLKLTSGKHTIFVDKVYNNLKDIVTLSSTDSETIDLINKGEVNQKNLYQVYDKIFENIINQVVVNKATNKEEANKKNDNFIEYVEKLENETEGNKTHGGNVISTVLKEIKNEKNLKLDGNELNEYIEKRKNRCREQLQKIIKVEYKRKKDKKNYEIIVLMDCSKYMENYAEDFVQNILTQVFIQIGLNENDKIRLYNVNDSLEESNIQIKKLRNIEIECKGNRELFDALNEARSIILNFPEKNYILLTILSGEIKDNEDVRILAYKMLCLNSKVRIFSRVIKYITNKSDFPKKNNGEIDEEKEDIITYGLIKQLNTEGMKDCYPLVLKESDSQDYKINEIVKLINIKLEDLNKEKK